jgi:hypothetical protein
MPDYDPPTDPASDPFERLGLQGGSRESMKEIANKVKAFDSWRKGVSDPHDARLAREISESHYRQINIMALIAKAFREPKREVDTRKAERPLGLIGHLRAWLRELRG